MSLQAPDNKVGSFAKAVEYHNTYSKYDHYNGAPIPPVYDIYDIRHTDEWFKSETAKGSWSMVQGIPFRQPTSYSRHVIKYRYERGEITRPWASNPQWITETLTGIWSGINPHDINPDSMSRNLGILKGTDGYNQAVTECLLKLNESKAQLGQYLAETKQVAESVAGLGTELLETLLAVKHGRFVPPKFGKVLTRGRDAYLQWNFGWKPLCSDIHDQYKLLTEGLNIGNVLKAKRTVKTPYDYSTTIGGDKVDVKVKHTDTCKIWASLSGETLAKAQAMSIVNPLSVAWEVIPYSFVVDWFAPVGNTIAALTATAGLDFVGGYSGQTREGSITVHGVGTIIQDFFFYDRLAHSSFPSGGFYGKQNPLSLDKGMKILALLSQLF
jgi:hypothetical protein